MNFEMCLELLLQSRIKRYDIALVSQLDCTYPWLYIADYQDDLFDSLASTTGAETARFNYQDTTRNSKKRSSSIQLIHSTSTSTNGINSNNALIIWITNIAHNAKSYPCISLLHIKLGISSHVRSFWDDKQETRAVSCRLPNLKKYKWGLRMAKTEERTYIEIGILHNSSLPLIQGKTLRDDSPLNLLHRKFHT